MVELASAWPRDVDRGPGWLIVKLHAPSPGQDETYPLAEDLWHLLEQNLANRLVLDLDEVFVLHSYLLGQLVLLHKRICSHGGVMRLCGVSEGNQCVIRTARLDQRFPAYADRHEAVCGYRPVQPR